MLKKVDTKVDFIAIEHEILNFWRENQIFQKRVDANRGKPKWSFLDGPITANNPMGVHHAWGRTYKDIFQRYKAMMGYDLRYQNGFDCQGLWVEVEVEKELGFKSKTDIEDFGVENFVNACKERVRRFSKIQTEQSIRLGYWMDWNNSYYTMDDENNYTIWHFLKQCHNRGWIYKGFDVMPWCIDCGAALSEHEIATEGYAERTHTSVYLELPLNDSENEKLLVWTTTPWTLTSNVAAAVHPEMDYVKVKQGDEILYLVESRIDILKEKGSYKILNVIKGIDLVGKSYSGPFDEFEAQKEINHPVIAWDEVNDKEGTGIVHIAPGCGHEDFILSKEYDLAVLAPLDQFGTYLEGFGFLTGKNVRDVNNEIFDHLKKNGKLYKKESYTHRYPICWRHKSDLVFRLVDEWFISMREVRHDIMEVTKQIRWIPEWGMDRELDWLKNMDDWMISKKRYWGLALPIYNCDHCGYVTVIGSNEELKEKATEGWEQFSTGNGGKGHSPHKPWIDQVKIACDGCGITVSRIPDVGNPWLDAGIVPYSTIHYRTKPEYWKEWFPPDFITESLPGQFRNWFYSLLTMSTVLENKPPFKTVLGHALVKDEKGDDMHKSAGNAIWFEDAAEEMGVDVMRWMFSAQNPENNLLFGYERAREIRKKLITLWNTYSFFVTYARLDNFNPNTVTVSEDDYTELDKWIISKMNLLIYNVAEGFTSYRVEKFMRQLSAFLEDLSNWYIRRNRRRFWKSENDSDKNAAYKTLYNVLVDLIKVLAPILPFITEKIYQNLVLNIDPESPESVHLCDYPVRNISQINRDIVEEIDMVVKLVELGRYARNKANLKVRQPLSKLEYYVSDDKKISAIVKNSHQILEELNVKSVEKVESDVELITFELEANLPLLGKRFGSKLPEVRKAISNTKYSDVMHKIKSDEVFLVYGDSSNYEIYKDEIKVKINSKEGKSVVTEDGITVSIDTNLTDELIQEGIVRDVIRSIQNMRKDAGLNVEDRISLWCNPKGIVKESLENFSDYFCNEVLAMKMDLDSIGGQFSQEIVIKGEKVNFGISKYLLN